MLAFASAIAFIFIMATMTAISFQTEHLLMGFATYEAEQAEDVETAEQPLEEVEDEVTEELPAEETNDSEEEQPISGAFQVLPPENKSLGSITQRAVANIGSFSSSLAFLMITIIASIITIGSAFVVFKPEFPAPVTKKRSGQIPASYFYKQQLMSYVLSAISAGQPREFIWSSLLQSGWPPQLISEVFRELRL